MSVTVSSYVPSLTDVAATRNADILPFPFLARPQATTIYVRFVEVGTIAVANFTILMAVGNANTPYLLLRKSGSAVYRFDHNNAMTNVAVEMAAGPSLGDKVELVAQLNADGSVKLIQSINGATSTESSTSSANVLAQTWAGAILYLNSQDGAADGYAAFRNVVIHRGVQSLATMRRLAGV